MSKEVYVTGANGFIGRNLALELGECQKVPHDKILTTPYTRGSDVYFFSTYGNMAFHTDEAEIVKANVTDLIHVLNAVKEKDGFSTFVYASSSSVRLRVQTVYSRCKRAAEEILLSYMERYNSPVCIIRPFSVTGVGEQPKHLIPTLIRSCIDGEQMRFVPDPVHDFIDVEDLVSGVLNLTQHKARGIYELGTGQCYTNQQVLQIVEEVTGKRANLTTVDSLRPYDNEEWCSTNFNARRYGWLPKVTLRQSIERMVQDYVANRA